MELSGATPEELQLFYSLIIISVLTLPFKGLALWKAAGRQNKGWFIALLLINTIGILDIVYYFFLDTDQNKPKPKPKKPASKQ